MSKEYTAEELQRIYNVEKWKKALRIAEIKAEKHCDYSQAEKIYNTEKSKKDMREN